MKELEFKKIDAFATANSTGNPAGAVYLNNVELTPAEMLKIAKELKGFVSEVGYVKQVNNDTFDLKYFSSEREVDFCGHATIGIMYDLIKNNHELRTKKHIKISTNMGNLIVENKIETDDAVFITAPNPQYRSCDVKPEAIAEKFMLNPDQIALSHPISIINAGLNTLIVPIKTLDSILSISPSLNELKDFCLDHSADIIIVYTNDVASPLNKYRTRVFAPTFGYLEDPATGSGNSALAYYLLKHNLWDGTPIKIEQNSTLNSPNIVNLATENNTGKNPQVIFGGGAITKIIGKYILN